MKSLIIEASLLEIVWSDTIEYLHINWMSISDYCVSLKIFPLDSLPRLRKLYLGRFPNLEMISQDHVHNHLEDMTIKECPKFESLPANMHTLLPSLNELLIEDCPKLESFPAEGLPSNLKFMKLNNCSTLLVDSLNGAFRDNPSLERLSIEKVDAECFPNEGLLPPSLTHLTIIYSPNLKKLDYKGLYQLSSLRSLTLSNCPNLQCLPEEGLPKSISNLQISWCRLLKKRCLKERGEDWEKISHIQTLYIR
ncbi:putative disease resistance protein At3g14460 [Vigna unguiculata]|uniref:putative disease resistance protein At3g14460 n=1 Tax=Vigna unguiculata TaxID=3917 RepID=UPI001015DCA5|nr:putative disease resistance protein At3g14460 [Vigna unguiculata]